MKLDFNIYHLQLKFKNLLMIDNIITQIEMPAYFWKYFLFVSYNVEI